MALTNISGPGTLSKAGETYVLTTDITASGTAFTISANNITLDGQGHTVTYATGGSGNAVNFDNRGGVTVKNLTIQLPADSAASGATAIKGDNSISSTVDNCTINLDRGTAQGNYAIRLHNSNSDTVSNCNITYRPVAHGIDIDQCNNDRVFSNTILLRANYTDAYSISINASCYGMPTAGGTQIYGNRITVEGGSGTYKGIGIGVGMDFRNGAIYGNIITNACENARALMLDSNSQNNDVYGNDLTTTAASCRGIRIRDSSNNRIYNNTVRTTGSGGNALEIGRSGVGSPYPCTGNYVHDNTFVATSAAAIDAYDYGDGNSFANNTLTSNSAAIVLINVPNHTFTREHFVPGPAPVSSYADVIIDGMTGYGLQAPATNNVLIDPVKSGDLRFNWGSHTYDLTLKWTCTINVQNASGGAVEGATVNVTDASGATVFTATTGPSGSVETALAQWVQSSPSTRITKTPHTITVSKSGFPNQQATVTADHAQTVTISLSGNQPIVSLAADNLSPKPGQAITYTITYANQSDAVITNCVVKTTVPAHTTFVADSAGSGVYDSQTRLITWTIGTLIPGQQGQVSYQTMVD